MCYPKITLEEDLSVPDEVFENLDEELRNENDDQYEDYTDDESMNSYMMGENEGQCEYVTDDESTNFEYYPGNVMTDEENEEQRPTNERGDNEFMKYLMNEYSIEHGDTAATSPTMSQPVLCKIIGCRCLQFYKLIENGYTIQLPNPGIPVRDSLEIGSPISGNEDQQRSGGNEDTELVDVGNDEWNFMALNDSQPQNGESDDLWNIQNDDWKFMTGNENQQRDK